MGAYVDFLHSYSWKISLLLLLSRFSRVRLCATPETAARQAPLSLGFSRQEHWSGLPFPSPMQGSEKWKGSRSVVSDSSRPHGLQPTRLLRPWDFPGKSAGVGCHCLLRKDKPVYYIHKLWSLLDNNYIFLIFLFDKSFKSLCIYPLDRLGVFSSSDYYRQTA